MSVKAYGEYIDAKTVRFERLLPGPIERVWEYLLDSEKRGKWLAPGELNDKPGSKVELRFNHRDLNSYNEEPPEEFRKPGVKVIEWTVKEVLPPRLLVVWWSYPGESEVKFELAPRGDKVLLTLTHSNVQKRDMLRGVSGGWHTHLDILADQLNGSAPGPFWSKIQKLWKEYDAKIPG